MRRQDVGEIIRSLAYQLALRFPGFADSLLALEPAEVESLSDPARAWETLLKKPLLLLRGAHVVLLFDALDEAGSAGTSISKVLSLVLDLGRINAGAALSMIVTTRPETGILSALRSRWRINARDFTPASLRHGDEHSRLLMLMQRQLNGMPLLSVDTAFAVIFGDAAPETRDGTARLLSILMAARQPPSMVLLEALGVRGACALLPGWGLLFFEHEHCVHVLHKSLAEWIVDVDRSGRHVVDVSAGHRAWTEVLSAQVRPLLESSTPSLVPAAGSYVYAHLLPHLDAAGRAAEARAALMRLPWLQATLRERGLYALLSDVAVRMVSGDGTLSLLHRTLRLAAPGLQSADAAEALPGQLVGRLGGLLESASPEVKQLYAAAYCWRGSLAWLRPVKPTLRAPVGALEMRLEGHTNWVKSVVALANERVVSSSGDNTLRVWNVATGECERMLEGHVGSVLSLVVLDDGRVISGSEDKSLRVWNADTGECECTLDGHAGAVKSLLALADGRVISGSQDKTLRVWNVVTGECERTLKGHSGPVMSLTVLTDGRVVSGADDSTLRVWNATNGECERTLEGHTDAVSSLVVLADWRLVSGSKDSTLRVWNVATGKCERTLTGHTRVVWSLVPLVEGRVVSASGDGMLRVWNPITGECEQTLEGNGDHVESLVVLLDGRVVSGSGDKTLRVWNVVTGECERTLKGHSGPVMSLTVLTDGRVVSSSGDDTLCVWNVATGECERTLEGHTDSVWSLTALTDGRVVSWSQDQTLRVWRVATGECERTLTGHTGEDMYLQALAEGRVLSATHGENMMCVWNAATGECEQVLRCRSEGPLVVLMDKRVVSRASEGKLRVWNLATGECEQVLHAGSEAAAMVLSQPRFQLHDGAGESLQAPVERCGSCLAGAGFARMYADSLPWVVCSCPDGEFIAAGTSAGAVHSFEVIPAATTHLCGWLTD